MTHKFSTNTGNQENRTIDGILTVSKLMVKVGQWQQEGVLLQSCLLFARKEVRERQCVQFKYVSTLMRNQRKVDYCVSLLPSSFWVC